MKNGNEVILKSTCRGCHGVCGVLVHIRNGRVIKITGDKDCPTSEGYTCAKGRAAVELLYHPDRLKYPLKRSGERGENKWQRITWDEALDTVAGKFLQVKREYGVQSIAGHQGTGRPYTILFTRLMNALGTPTRFGGGHICYLPRFASAHMTIGRFPVCDYYGFGGVYPRCVVVWGCNVAEYGASDGMCGYQVNKAVRRPGTKSIVIDPRRTKIAEKATHHLQVRPGVDDALALGMLHVIINEELYDRDFVERWTAGFEDLKQRVQDYTPERVAEITRVPADEIRAASRTYATTKPACIQWGVSVDQNINNIQTSRAILCLSAITGNLDVPGGDVFWVPPENVVVQSMLLNPGLAGPPVPPEIGAKRIGAGKYSCVEQVHPHDFYDAVMSEKPYPVKALFNMGGNTLVSNSYSPNMLPALKKIDFVVAADLFMTPTAQLADIVLPAASWLEVDDVADIHFVWCALIRQKVATIGECRDDKQIMIDLAHRLGLSEHFPWRTARDYCDWVLKDSGISFEEFARLGIIKADMRYRKYEQEGFNTPSGKVELRCSGLEKLGFDPLPFYVEPPESPVSKPELCDGYPLIMTTGARTEPYFHSEGRQIESLRKLIPDPQVEIHPENARELGIAHNDWVSIESPRGGKIKMKANVTDGIMPGVVSAQHSWWFPEKSPPEYGYRESNVNMLTGGLPFDPHSGSESWRSFLCRVSKL